MRYFYLLFMAVVVTGAMLAGCGGGSSNGGDQDPETYCQSDNDCPLGSSCIGNQCVYPHADGDPDLPDRDDVATELAEDTTTDEDLSADPDPDLPDQDPAEEPADQDTDPADTTEIVDQDLPPGTACYAHSDCQSGQLCNFLINRCLTQCNPFAPSCPGGTTCVVPDSGKLSPYGFKGWCAYNTQAGLDEGVACVPGQCKQGLVCSRMSRCARICDPQGSSAVCGDGKLCGPDPRLGVGICGVCGLGIGCPDGLACDNGQCVSAPACDTYTDCTPPATTCISGLCRQGCTVTGCSSGVCNPVNGYCEQTCSPACDPGYCCNNGVCGPCCDTQCGAGFACTTRLSDCATATCPCCAPIFDCRSDPSLCAFGEICDETTGQCRNTCPSSCPYGMKCSGAAGYVCIPKDPEACEFGAATCSDNCSTCILDGLTGGACLPNLSKINQENCTFVCIEEGVVTWPDGILCCPGLIACKDRNDFSYCCQAANCQAGGDGCVMTAAADGDQDSANCEWEPDIEEPEPVETVYREAESTVNTGSSSSGVSTTSFSGASGGQVVCMNSTSGMYVAFDVNFPTSGKWQVEGVMLKGRSFAIVRLTVDNRTMTNNYDGYVNGAEALADPFNFGQMTLSAADHDLVLRATSHDPSSSGYKFCVDRWILKRYQ